MLIHTTVHVIDVYYQFDASGQQITGKQSFSNHPDAREDPRVAQITEGDAVRIYYLPRDPEKHIVEW